MSKYIIEVEKTVDAETPKEALEVAFRELKTDPQVTVCVTPLDADGKPDETFLVDIDLIHNTTKIRPAS